MKQYFFTPEMNKRKKINRKSDWQEVRSMGGLWEVLREVLHEVFQAFPFYNSLILNDLWKTTGGLGRYLKNSQFTIDWKAKNVIAIGEIIFSR